MDAANIFGSFAAIWLNAFNTLHKLLNVLICRTNMHIRQYQSANHLYRQSSFKVNMAKCKHKEGLSLHSPIEKVK